MHCGSAIVYVPKHVLVTLSIPICVATFNPMKKLSLLILSLAITLGLSAQKKKTETPEPLYKSSDVSGLQMRSIGPALTSGRIIDIAVQPENPFEYYVAVASGGVWKTSNSGNTYTPIFDTQASYSIGCVSIAPSNPSVVWVGTGENNNQRSVAYGDGVYKSIDGGKSWKNMGLKSSEHIGKIIIHPEDENTVYVAAYGPLWNAGGERGVYRTSDGGESWELLLEISKHTGISDMAMDPRDPNVIYAAAHQRRRHVWTYIDGGPESGIHKTIDGGKTWKKLENGLPKNDMGRIGLAIAPANPDVVYAIIKATENGGFYRSSDRGGSWKKMSDYQTSGNYYQEIVCDPYDTDKVFSLSTWLHHTEDGGKTFKKTGEKHKHVDNHAMWIDPKNTDHWIVGCDGGVYETWDHATNWHYKPNLPVTQFYKVAVDNAEPFYNVYGGTQDNNTLGGPSRTIKKSGIDNRDWIITNGGDGFEPQIDPKDENIVYGQAQYGWLVRYDKKSGERVGIQPQPKEGEKPYRWNWDAPLLISPHNNKRLYFCANRVFKSDNQGDSWETISEDLSRGIDRNTLKVMDRVWGIDAVMKNMSTSIYGNIVAFDESPVKEGLLYAGTDDGLIHVNNANGSWLQYDGVPGVPSRTYVNALVASQHDESRVYAAFNNHKNGDFKPYLYRSDNKGASWVNIAGNLPERGSVYSIAEDHEDPNLLFAGTEFGLFYTIDGGKEWTQLKAGIPTIAVRDIALQRRENDVVVATFGRGFYILDDYSPLRELSKELKEKEAHIFSIKDGLSYIESNPLGLREQGSQGEAYYWAMNPPYGATFTYYVKEKPKTLKEQRQEEEKEKRKNNGDVSYPSFTEIRAEANEDKPFHLFIIKDSDGNEVRKIKQKVKKGINRVTWNYRFTTTSPIKLKKSKPGRYSGADDGMMALPGDYTVELHQSVNGELKQLVGPTPFKVTRLNNTTMPASDMDALLAFQKSVGELRRSIAGSSAQLGETEKRMKFIKQAIVEYPGVPLTMTEELNKAHQKFLALKIQLWGDSDVAKHQFETPNSISSKIGNVVWNSFGSSAAPSGTQKMLYESASKEHGAFRAELEALMNTIEGLEKELEKYGTPYVPGRDSDWKED